MNNHSNHLYEFGRYRLDAEERVLFRGGQAVHLPLKAIDLLIVLVERRGQMVSKEQLMELLWRDTVVEEANLAQNIFLLRKVFSETGGGRKWIETIPRRGYRFVAKVKELSPATNNIKIESPLHPTTDQSFAPTLAAAENDSASPQAIPVTKEAFAEDSVKLPTAERTSLWQSRKLRLISLTAILGFFALAIMVYLNLARKSAPPDTPGRSTTNLIRLTNNTAADYFPRWSPDGAQIAFASNRDGKYEIYVMDADGANVKRLTNNQADDSNPAWSPDGAKIAFASDRDGNQEIYVMNTDGTNQVRLTTNPSVDDGPSWSPDGKQIAFASNRNNHYVYNFDIWVMNSDGTQLKQLTTDPEYDVEPRWSPDGKKICFARLVGAPPDKDNLFMTDADGNNVRRLTSAPTIDDYPAWSPDGKRIAFQSNRDGNWEIYVLTVD